MGLLTSSSLFDKDPKANYMDQEFGILVRPSREMKIHKEERKTSIPEYRHKFIRLKKISVQVCDQEEERSLSQCYDIIVPVPLPVPSPLGLKKLEIPSHEVQKNDDCNDGFKTPTSLDHKISPTLECPGAPKKKITKTPPKLKASRRRRLVIDHLSKEVEPMFTMPFMEVLPGVGDKNKKPKRCMQFGD